MRDRRIRLARGRLCLYVEPRDFWVGVYVSEDKVYVLLLPMLVIRWERSSSWGLPKR